MLNTLTCMVPQLIGQKHNDRTTNTLSKVLAILRWFAQELALQLPMTSGQGHFQELSLHVLRIPSRFHDGNGGRVSPRPSGLPAKLPRMPLPLLRLMLSAALSAGLPAYLHPELQILTALLGTQRSAK